MLFIIKLLYNDSEFILLGELKLNINNISKYFISADVCFDYIPVISTFTNLLGLFQKCIFLLPLENIAVKGGHYYTHMKQKSFARCVVLLVPVIGNIFIGILDCNAKYRDPNRMLAAFRRDHHSLNDANYLLKDDKEFMLDVCRINCEAIAHANGRLLDDKEFMLDVCRINWRAIMCANDRLRGDKEFMLDACRINPQAVLGANDRLKDDKEFMLVVIEKNHDLFRLASQRLQNDWAFQIDAIRKNDKIVKKFTFDIDRNTDREFLLEAIHANPKVLEYICSLFPNDPEFATISNQYDPFVQK